MATRSEAKGRQFGSHHPHHAHPAHDPTRSTLGVTPTHRRAPAPRTPPDLSPACSCSHRACKCVVPAPVRSHHACSHASHTSRPPVCPDPATPHNVSWLFSGFGDGLRFALPLFHGEPCWGAALAPSRPVATLGLPPDFVRADVHCSGCWCLPASGRADASPTPRTRGLHDI